MVKVLLVFGTRPEAIKMAPVYKALQSERNVNVRICVTAQHRQMLDQVLTVFDIRPHYDLNIMKPNQSLSELTSRAIASIDEVISGWGPDLVLVHGDTATTFSACLAAFYRGVPVGHVEAGLRTSNLQSPWPEEANRRLTAVLSSMHFSPTLRAKENLVREGVRESDIFVTGNTVIDALRAGEKLVDGKTDNFFRHFIGISEVFAHDKKMILVTGHRRENFGIGLENICSAILELSQRSDVEVVYPVHLNPNVREPVLRMLGQRRNVHIIEPVGYLEFIFLMKQSYVILTDSGGVQEEAPSLAKPVLLTRDTTERPEAVEAGTVELVGTGRDNIICRVSRYLDDEAAYSETAKARNPYGDGNAADRIRSAIVERFG